jgi:hypothetical protein
MRGPRQGDKREGKPVRTGSEYREALHDGRRVWVMGEGLVEDVTTHPATRAMVDEYVAWYDRHQDPAWQDVLLAPPDAAAPTGGAAVGPEARSLIHHGPPRWERKPPGPAS